MNDSDLTAVKAVRDWLEQVVIAKNFCPFASTALARQQVRFVACSDQSDEGILTVLHGELDLLAHDASVETTLIIITQGLADFGQYNQFLDLADSLLDQLEWTGVFQVASFHPRYQFAGTSVDDPSNYTNRAPYSVLHLLRESSVDWAVNNHKDVDAIPQRNIQWLANANQQELADIKQYSRSPKCVDQSTPSQN